MADEKSSQMSFPPAYVVSGLTEQVQQPKQKSPKALFGYAVAVSVALVVTLILGGVYYYRSLDVIQDSIRHYSNVDKTGSSPVNQDIEINKAKNTMVFRLSGDGIEAGTFAVLDYSKSLTGIYDPKEKTCYLIGGIQKDIVDPNTYANNMDKNVTRPTTVETLKYQLADTYPVSDKSILPAELKTACAYLPVYWLEPAAEKTGIQKRAICFLRYCFYSWGRRYCVYKCY
jgi:hypothetical protein